MRRNRCIQNNIVKSLDDTNQVSAIAVGEIASPHAMMGVKIPSKYNVSESRQKTKRLQGKRISGRVVYIKDRHSANIYTRHFQLPTAFTKLWKPMLCNDGIVGYDRLVFRTKMSLLNAHDVRLVT